MQQIIVVTNRLLEAIQCVFSTMGKWCWVPWGYLEHCGEISWVAWGMYSTPTFFMLTTMRRYHNTCEGDIMIHVGDLTINVWGMLSTPTFSMISLLGSEHSHHTQDIHQGTEHPLYGVQLHRFVGTLYEPWFIINTDLLMLTLVSTLFQLSTSCCNIITFNDTTQSDSSITFFISGSFLFRKHMPLYIWNSI